MNYKYFNNALDKYYQTYQRYHPMHDKRINLIWLRVRDKDTFQKVGQIGREPQAAQNAHRQVRDRVQRHRLVPRRLSRHLPGRQVHPGAGGAGQHGPGDRQRHQHQRARTPRRDGRLEGAGFSARAGAATGPGRIDPVGQSAG